MNWRPLNGIFHLPSDFSVDQWRHEAERDRRSRRADGMDAHHASKAELGEDVDAAAEKRIMLWAVDSRCGGIDRPGPAAEGIGLQALAQADRQWL